MINKRSCGKTLQSETHPCVNHDHARKRYSDFQTLLIFYFKVLIQKKNTYSVFKIKKYFTEETSGSLLKVHSPRPLLTFPLSKV